jgi:hydroxylamine reductase
MFCYQCEQRTGPGASGCDRFGVCGKDPATSSLQDLLVRVAQGVSVFAREARRMRAAAAAAEAGNAAGADTTVSPTLSSALRDADVFVVEALFTTVTNVNFDPDRIEGLLRKGFEIRKRLAEAGGLSVAAAPAVTWEPAPDLAGLVEQGDRVTEELLARSAQMGPDVAGTMDLVLFGLKGMAAYVDHAMVLGVEDDEVFAFFHEVLAFLLRRDVSLDEALAMALRVGEVNVRAMQLLDKANTTAYGHPSPTKVRVTPVKGKAILVSGHDLRDLEAILKQTEGKGINVYTHGEMLPAHGYPELREYAHLVGNYGGAWQDQRTEFEQFPGAIVMTTNCIQKPKHDYIGRIFTSGLVAWPGVAHISDRDFTPVIDVALAAPGFEADEPEHLITVGFGHNAILSVADRVIEGVKNGKIKRFFLIGGCDGAKSGRNYYTELARAVPEDCMILTLACGKYRFNKLEFGAIDGIPRLLDVGQCNDAYSAVVVAQELAKAFGTDLNGLPLSLVLSWYEQKAVCVLLSLLYLGIRNIRLGPSLPAFLTPSVVDVLHEKFNIMPITSAIEDLAAIMA